MLVTRMRGNSARRAGVAVAARYRATPAISVVGLGYVGAVSMACLAHLGFRMVGVDVSLDKVRAIKEGRSPIVEARLGELLREGVDARPHRCDAEPDCGCSRYRRDVHVGRYADLAERRVAI